MTLEHPQRQQDVDTSPLARHWQGRVEGLRIAFKPPLSQPPQEHRRIHILPPGRDPVMSAQSFKIMCFAYGFAAVHQLCFFVNVQ